MLSKAFTNFTLTYLPIIGLFIFVGVFVAVCIFVFRKKNKAGFEQASQIPLDQKDHKMSKDGSTSK